MFKPRSQTEIEACANLSEDAFWMLFMLGHTAFNVVNELNPTMAAYMIEKQTKHSIGSVLAKLMGSKDCVTKIRKDHDTQLKTLREELEKTRQDLFMAEQNRTKDIENARMLCKHNADEQILRHEQLANDRIHALSRDLESLRTELDNVQVTKMTEIAKAKHAEKLVYEHYKKDFDARYGEIRHELSCLKKDNEKIVDKAVDKAVESERVSWQRQVDALNKHVADLQDVVHRQNLRQSKTVYVGQDGEKTVAAILASVHGIHDILDTSKLTASGDMHALLPDNKILLVEVKNKQTITTSDIEKFRRDLLHAERLKPAHMLCAGLFISVRTPRLPGMPSTTYLDMSRGMPHLYLGFASMDDLSAKLAVYVEFFVSICMSYTADKNFDVESQRRLAKINDELTEIHKMTNTHKSHIEKMLHAVDKLHEKHMNIARLCVM